MVYLVVTVLYLVLLALLAHTMVLVLEPARIVALVLVLDPL